MNSDQIARVLDELGQRLVVNAINAGLNPEYDALQRLITSIAKAN